MTVSSYSRQINLLSQTAPYTVDTSNRIIIKQGAEYGTSLGSMSHLHSLVHFTNRYNEYDNNIREAYLTLKTAVGGLWDIAQNLASLRSVSFAAIDNTLPDSNTNTTDRLDLIAEARSLMAGIDSVADGTERHGIKLLNGSIDSKTYLIDDRLIGPYNNINEFTTKLQSVTSEDLGLNNIDLKSASSSAQSVVIIDAAIAKINQALSDLSQDMHVMETRYAGTAKDSLLSDEIRTLSYNVDFTTNNSFYRHIQAVNRPSLPYLNSGVSLSKGSVSFYI